MKKTLIIIAFLVGALVAYYAGYHTARKLARQDCIDKVSENCEYICGVGAEFYYPDQQRQRSDDEGEWERENMIATKGDL
jgi:hypothetical protein